LTHRPRSAVLISRLKNNVWLICCERKTLFWLKKQAESTDYKPDEHGHRAYLLASFLFFFSLSPHSFFFLSPPALHQRSRSRQPAELAPFVMDLAAEHDLLLAWPHELHPLPIAECGSVRSPLLRWSVSCSLLRQVLTPPVLTSDCNSSCGPLVPPHTSPSTCLWNGWIPDLRAYSQNIL
jgi:hypothetical protein